MQSLRLCGLTTSGAWRASYLWAAPAGAGCRPLFTTSATARSRPRCTAWCSSTPRHSSSRPRSAPEKDPFWLHCSLPLTGHLVLKQGQPALSNSHRGAADHFETLAAPAYIFLLRRYRPEAATPPSAASLVSGAVGALCTQPLAHAGSKAPLARRGCRRALHAPVVPEPKLLI